ncbi:hypothetical protein Dsin_019154 [Dipteronia sinensis]|uniref:RNase H type-1 domain-containing protein n=1 Tax=Dipteronia sinensis TaxID=43782 RepID=A0AAE0E2K7_9ROSI|nr:hypothetical protein Dsin_019154 [Dipteronia sinensis]
MKVLYWNIRGIGNPDSRLEFSHIYRSQKRFVFLNLKSARRHLWDDMLSLSSSVSSHWLAIGDFNAVIGAHEKSGGVIPSVVSCNEFQFMSDNYNLIHMPTSGSLFTWMNCSASHFRIEIRLDRSLYNPSWLDVWPSSYCLTLPRTVSDHNPFIFNGCLKSWNFSVFGDVHLKVSSLKQKLSDVQESIQTERASQNLLDQEISIKQDYMHALRVQDSFWKGKCRLKWLVDGDRCSKKFHTYAKMLDRKAFGGNVGLKIDIKKAFDTMSWDFLLGALSRFDFHSTFINSVEVILHSARLSILVNGTPNGFFAADSRSLNTLKDFIDSYGVASGQLVSIDKSSYFLGRHSLARKAIMESILCFKEGTFPFVYLGVPVFRGSPRGVYFQPLLDHVKARFATWKGYLLSMVVHAQLIQSVIQPMPIHCFRIYKIPSSILLNLRRCCLRDCFSSISRHSRWLIGDGSLINLWKDTWLDRSILSLVNYHGNCSSLSYTVSSFICHGCWCIPASFIFGFPHVADMIRKVFLPPNNAQDQLVWELSRSGTPSFAELYDFVQGFKPKVTCSKVVYDIWKARNDHRFRNKAPFVDRIISNLRAKILLNCSICPGYMYSADSSLMNKLGVKPHLRKALCITSCVWCPLSYPWIKANTDGCGKGNPGDGACSCVFRNGNSSFIGGFSHNLGVCTSFVVEMHATLHVICFAFDRGWRWFWLETDSMAVISCFSNPNYSPSWQLCNFWFHSKHLSNQMHFVITHTFWEGNMVADILANEGLKVSGYVWWDNSPSCIVKQLHLDSWGVPDFCFH